MAFYLATDRHSIIPGELHLCLPNALQLVAAFDDVAICNRELSFLAHNRTILNLFMWLRLTSRHEPLTNGIDKSPDARILLVPLLEKDGIDQQRVPVQTGATRRKTSE